MTRKTKPTAKTPKRGKGASGNLKLVFDDVNWTYESDRVYTKKDLDPITQAYGDSSDQQYDWSVEFELSKNYLIYTFQITDKSDPAKSSHVRHVFAGDFTYDSRGALSGGKVYAAGTDNTKRPGEGDSNRFYGQVYLQPSSGLPIGSARSWSGWYSFVNDALAYKKLTSEYGDFGEVDSAPPSSSVVLEDGYYISAKQSEGQTFYFQEYGGGLDEVRAFGGGRFFQDNWWESPFASNLV